MKNSIIKKIKSQGGASMMLAMILLLVCTTVGAAILTSVSASAGRLSNQAKADARYYSVRSAAELLIEKIDGQSYVLVRGKSAKTTTVSEYDNGTNTHVVKSSVQHNPDYTVSLNGAPVSGYDSILAYMFIDFSGAEAVPSETMFNAAFPVISTPKTCCFDFIHELGGSGNNLNVSITGIINPNGSLVFEINSNKDALDNYVLSVTFTAEISDNMDNPDLSTSESYVYTDDGKTIAKTVTANAVRTSTVTWTYAGIK